MSIEACRSLRWHYPVSGSMGVFSAANQAAPQGKLQDSLEPDIRQGLKADMIARKFPANLFQHRIRQEIAGGNREPQLIKSAMFPNLYRQSRYLQSSRQALQNHVSRKVPSRIFS
jgi:hypothetical protein